jgi:hypothetical protein
VVAVVSAFVLGTTIHGYGLRMDLPPGWHGRVSHGNVAAATFPIPRGDTGLGRATRRRMRRGDLLLFISEWEPMPGEHPPCLPRRYAPPLSGPRSFCLSARHFVVFVRRRGPTPARTVAQANRALRSFRVRAGDFYPGRVRPARFSARPGWRVGTSGAGAIGPSGAQTGSWAATVPYRDPPFQLPPQATLRLLPRNGILIWLGLWRDSRQSPGAMSRTNSLRIAPQKIFRNFEGMPPRYGLYRALVPRRRYVLDLWVFFGRPHPARRVVARAQAELDAVRLPRWPRL